MQTDNDMFPPPPRSRTLTSMVMLLVAATIFSYLACYAIPQVLVHADLLSPWPAADDPRPGWMLKTFGCLVGGCFLLWGWLRLLSWRQMRRMDLDAMTD